MKRSSVPPLLRGCHNSFAASKRVARRMGVGNVGRVGSCLIETRKKWKLENRIILRMTLSSDLQPGSTPKRL